MRVRAPADIAEILAASVNTDAAEAVLAQSVDEAGAIEDDWRRAKLLSAIALARANSADSEVAERLVVEALELAMDAKSYDPAEMVHRFDGENHPLATVRHSLLKMATALNGRCGLHL